MREPSRGFTIIEATVAVMVLAVTLGSLVPLVRLLQLAQHESAGHRQALRVADNLLERVLMLDWQDLRADLPASAVQADALVDPLPGGEWELAVVEDADPVEAKRVTVSVYYTMHGQPENVSVTAWVYNAIDRGEVGE